MNTELPSKEIESLLHALRPKSLRPVTEDRMIAATQGTLLHTPENLLELEKELSHLKPRALSAELFSALEKTVTAIPFPLDQKVILFPGSRKTKTSEKREKKTQLLAVAAVAIMGGLAALLIPTSPYHKEITAHKNVPLQVVSTNYGTHTKSINDEALLWSEQSQPQRVIRVEYQDNVLTKDQNGVERMLLVPRQEILVVPAKVD